MRTVLMWIMVLSFFGLGVCDLCAGKWRLGVASLLLGVVQLVIFWR